MSVPVIAVVIGGWSKRWITDDGFINLRIARNIADGLGPVFNAGERVESGTSVAWVWLLALFEPLPFAMEWVAVVLGIGLTAGGVLIAQLAAARLDTRPGVAVPFGVLVFVAVPAVWDFTTSGLENGVSTFWLAGAFAALVLAHKSGSPRTLVIAGLFVGWGPLVRPDFGIVWVVFGAVLLVVAPASRRTRSLTAASLVFLAATYQLFRMGYFAALAPNTALAKEASGSRWDQGLAYLADFTNPYWLPLVLLLVVVVALSRRPAGRALWVWSAPLVAGSLHALYVVRVGGDFMHGRMLLPSLFLILLPVAAIKIRPRLAAVAPVVAVAVWAIVCASVLRPSYAISTEDERISIERSFYAQAVSPAGADWSNAPLVTVDDWQKSFYSSVVDQYETARSTTPLYAEVWKQSVDGKRVASKADTFSFGNLGIPGYRLGDVRVVDSIGLADAIAARQELVPGQRMRKPGHEKELPYVWFRARYAVPVGDMQETVAAQALSCGEPAAIIRATTAHLDAQLFASNVKNAWKYWQVRVPRDPGVAVQRFCR